MRYYLLNEKIVQLKPTTITVDIFDTLLLRKWQPEPWRFYKLAGSASTLLNKSGFRTTSLLIYSQRKYFSQVLRQANLGSGLDFETSFEDIFGTLIDDLCKRQNISIKPSEKTKLILKLKEIELEFEKKQLYLNKPLVKILKNTHKDNVKIFFVSDMYLSSQDIAKLLRHYKVSFITNGISSADKYVGKHSARSFVELANQNKAINLNGTLHIGDHRVGDKKNPMRVGVKTFWLYLPLHRLKLKAGKYVFNTILKTKVKVNLKNQTKKYQINSGLQNLNKPATTQQHAKSLGWLFAPAIIKYLHFLGIFAAANGSDVAFITSESNLLNDFYKKIGFKKANVLPQLNRNVMIQAYSHILLEQGYSLKNIISFAKKILRRKTDFSALATLGVVEPNSYKWELIGNKRIKSEINNINISGAKKKWLNQHKNVVSIWRSLKIDSKKIIFADVGWNDTIQIIFEEILKENNLENNNLSGKYLGRTGTNIFNSRIKVNSEGIIFNSLNNSRSKYLYQPEVWESFLNSDNLHSPTRQDIIDGINEAIEFFKKSQLSADDFYTINKKLLYKTLKKPSRQTIETMSSLNFDYGTLDEEICPLVNTSASKLKIYYWLMFNRAAFKDFYFKQGWKWGSATYYGYRIIYRLWRFKTKKPSF